MNKSKTTVSIVLALTLVFSLLFGATPFVYAEDAGNGQGVEGSEAETLLGNIEEGEDPETDAHLGDTEGGGGTETDPLLESPEGGVGTQSELQLQTNEDSTLITLADITVDTEAELAEALLNSAYTDIEVTDDIALAGGTGAGYYAPFSLDGSKNVYSTPGQNYTISRGAGYEEEMFSIVGQDSSNLTVLTLSDITLDGAYQGTPVGLISSLINVLSYGVLNLNSGAVVQNNPADVDGGGIFIGEGEATINGGKVINNSSAGSVGGGGVYNTGKLTFISGSISGNKALNADGGGVKNRTDFEQLGGEIANNSAETGGGVSNASPHDGPKYAVFTMSGGSIANNTAIAVGGGVDNYGYFTLSGGTISGNSCTDSNSFGGGIATGGANNQGKSDPLLKVDHLTRTTILGGSITGNSAAYGGGICAIEVFEGATAVTPADFITLIFSGGTISNNSASIAGGGVYIMTSIGLSKLNLSGNPQMTGNGIYVDGTLASALTVNGALQSSARILVEGSSAAGQMVGGALVANRQAGTGTLTEAEANTFMSLDGKLLGTLSGNTVIWKPADGLAKTADTSPLALPGILALAGLACITFCAASKRRLLSS